MTDSSQPNVAQLLATLAGNDAVERQSARHQLVAIGSSAVPGLLAALTDEAQHVRWEAAKALEGIADPAAAEGLVQVLGDDDEDVRWVAGEALISLQREALKPLLSAVSGSRDSEGLYKSAHHVLHELSKVGDLGPLLAPVVQALGMSEPEVAAPVAALKVLEQIG